MKKTLAVLFALCMAATIVYAKFPGQPPASPPGIKSSIYDSDADGLVDEDAGGTELDTSSSVGFPYIDNGVWAIDNAATHTSRGGGGGMNELSEDTTPQLGGNLDMNGNAIDNVSQVEMEYLNGVTSSIQTQIDLKAPLASPTFTGTVTLPDNTVIVTDNVAITGGAVDNVTIGGTIPPAATLSSLSVTGISEMSDNVTISDDKNIRFGTDADWLCKFVSATSQLKCETVNDGSGMTDNNAMMLFNVSVGGTLDDEQTVFAVQDNGVNLFDLDQDGDAVFLGEVQATAFSVPGLDNVYYINVGNNADPSSPADGDCQYRFDLDAWRCWNGSTWENWATVEDDAFASGWNGDTASAPSQNAVYDWGHTFDTDDDGDVDVVDGSIEIITTKRLSGPIREVSATTSPQSLSAAEVSSTVIHNYGVSSLHQYNLPDLTGVADNTAYVVTFLVLDSDGININPYGTDTLNGVIAEGCDTDAGGDSLQSTTTYSSVTLVAVSAGGWVVTNCHGTWVDAN